jgi:hypothetical protein
MDDDSGQWQDGRRAWERLHDWMDNDQSGVRGGGAALSALTDAGTLRRLLDRAELAGVRAARRYGKSWTEIATQLGVSRQSAWERWRDLDGTTPPSAVIPDPHVTPEAEAAAELVGRTARSRRRRASTVVPNVIGRSWDDAQGILLAIGLVAVGAEGAPDDSDAVVTDQSPESGAKIPSESVVKLWVGRSGGSAGVREPIRPRPTPREIPDTVR